MKAQFHPYIVDSDERKFFFLGIAGASFLAQQILLHNIIPWLHSVLTGFSVQFPAIPIPTDWALAISYSTCLGIFYFLFNSFIWKIKILQSLDIVKTPDVSGCWEGTGQSYDESGNVKHVFDIQLDITQNWSHISITSDGPNSESWSTSTHMFISNTRKKSITYTYHNEPKSHAGQNMSMHEGNITLSIKEDGQILEGNYYTGRGRQTYGTIKVKKVV